MADFSRFSAGVDLRRRIRLRSKSARAVAAGGGVMGPVSSRRWRQSGCPVVKGTRAAVGEAYAAGRDKQVFAFACAAYGETDDAVLGERADFARIADAVGVGVAPESEAGEFGAGEFAVGVVVERAHGFEAVAPEHGPGALADQVEAAADLAAMLGVPHQPGGVGREPALRARIARAGEVEGDWGGVAGERIKGSVRQGYDDRRDVGGGPGSMQAIAQASDCASVRGRFRQRPQVLDGFAENGVRLPIRVFVVIALREVRVGQGYDAPQMLARARRFAALVEDVGEAEVCTEVRIVEF